MNIELIVGIIALILAILGILYTRYIYSKEKIIRDIQYRLSQCRKFASWNFNSEDHLFEWMKNTEEGQLHHRNLFILFKIKKKVHKYLELHIEEEDKLPLKVLKRHYKKKK